MINLDLSKIAINAQARNVICLVTTFIYLDLDFIQLIDSFSFSRDIAAGP